MKVFIDCEFNDFQGPLISLALVDEAGREFYEVVRCENPSPWVANNVIPVLHKSWASLRMLQVRLEAWLAIYDAVHVIADWPEDIEHLCRVLITGPGQRVGTPPLTMEIRRDLSSAASAIPHNALEDAKAIRQAYLNKPHQTTERKKP